MKTNYYQGLTLACFFIGCMLVQTITLGQSSVWEKNSFSYTDDTETTDAHQHTHCKQEVYTLQATHFFVSQVDGPCLYDIMVTVQLPPDAFASTVMAIPSPLQLMLWDGTTMIAQQTVNNNQALFHQVEGNKTYTLRVTGPVPSYDHQDQAAFWNVTHIPGASSWRRRSADCDRNGVIDGTDALLLLNTRAHNQPAISDHYELIESTHVFANPLAPYVFTIVLDDDKSMSSYLLIKGKCNY